jgi:hypothetical protein
VAKPAQLCPPPKERECTSPNAQRSGYANKSGFSRGFKDRVRLLKKSVWDHSPQTDEITSDAGTSPHATDALTPPTPTSFEPSFCVEPAADSVLYLDYHFLSIGNLANMPSEEIDFLDIQGCLLVPRRQTMDSIVQQYFLYVHPLLPLLDEQSFWNIYSRRWAAADASGPKISLLVFQALLFAACNVGSPILLQEGLLLKIEQFVSFETLGNLGFSSLREAKAGFYSKAKVVPSTKLQYYPLMLVRSFCMTSGVNHRRFALHKPLSCSPVGPLQPTSVLKRSTSPG